MKNPVEPTGGPVTILGPSLRFKGELHAEEDLMIQGRVEGVITHSQRLTVCHEGHVTVEGDIVATESIVVTPSGSVLGDIAAPSVGVVEGAKFTGAVKMTRLPAPAVLAEPATVSAPPVAGPPVPPTSASAGATLKK